MTPNGIVFKAVLIVNGVSILAILVINRVWFLSLIGYVFKKLLFHEQKPYANYVCSNLTLV